MHTYSYSCDSSDILSEMQFTKQQINGARAKVCSLKWKRICVALIHAQLTPPHTNTRCVQRRKADYVPQNNKKKIKKL